MDSKSESQSGAIGPIVAAAHLADGALPALSELEFALTVLNNAYQRWLVRCVGAAGVPGLASLDVLILHLAAHRSREKTLAELCMLLNMEDTHVVAYALKKLEGLGLIETGRRGKEKTVMVTAKGAEACLRHREVREALLVAGVRAVGSDEAEISRLASLMRALSGQYDQAARSAASL